jgi:GTP-binding protein EngB required for normal cell division
MTQHEFFLAALGREGNALLRRGRALLEGSQNEAVRVLAARIPDAISQDGRLPRVVFVGQYGAGKSSLVKALTDRDVAIGDGIVTEQTSGFEWNGIEVVDTPGIHTEIRPDHDAITYEAIAQADLLVFVTTNELMDARIAAHFRELAVTRDLGHEMLLVINKMRRATDGNTQQSQAVIREALRDVLMPFTPEALRISFTDAELALKADALPPELQARAREASGLASFVEALNAFVHEKGILGRFTKGLYQLEQVLLEARALVSEGDPVDEALEQMLVQKRRALLDAQAKAQRVFATETRRVVEQVRQEGRAVSDEVHAGANSQALTVRVQAGQANVERYTGDLAARVQEGLSEVLQDLENDVALIAQSELARQVLPLLAEQLKPLVGQTQVSAEQLQKMKTLSAGVGRLGEYLLKGSFNPNANTFFGLFKLNQYANTEMHQVVLQVGQFFGKSFKPWEAVKWTRHIANASRVMTVVGTVATIGFQIWEDVENERLERDMRESRAAIRGGFNEAANVIEAQYDEQARTFVATTLAPEVHEVDEQLQALANVQSHGTKFEQELQGLLDSVQALIQQVHVSDARERSANVPQAAGVSASQVV